MNSQFIGSAQPPNVVGIFQHPFTNSRIIMTYNYLEFYLGSQIYFFDYSIWITNFNSNIKLNNSFSTDSKLGSIFWRHLNQN